MNKTEFHLHRILLCLQKEASFYGEMPQIMRDELQEAGITVDLWQNPPGNCEQNVSAIVNKLETDTEVSAATSTETGTEVDAETGTLWLTDSGAFYEQLYAAGKPVIGFYRDLAHMDEQFPHSPYVLTEPEWVDADSYEKIYERLKNLPWTILVTKRCIVRELTEEDVPALYKLYADAETKRFMPPLADNPEDEKRIQRAYIEKVYGLFGFGYWAVIDKTTGELIGRVGFGVPDDGDEPVSFGYQIRADRRRQGVALEVTSAVLAYAKRNLPFEHGICAHTDAANEASLGLLHKLGFYEKEDLTGGQHDQRTLFIDAWT